MMEDTEASIPVTPEVAAENIDLNSTGAPLVVDISDALSEKDRVKFTVHTKTTLPEFTSSEFYVVRHHEEFIWLHNTMEENEEYAGIIIPPAPPKPDFDTSREKLQTLGELEGRIPNEEFVKMKQELEAEYLATFKKTVAMHEVFLQRLSTHKLLKNDQNFKIFLEYQQELNVRGKNSREKLSGFFKNVTQSMDEVFLTNQKEEDDFFEAQRTHIMEYHARVKEATTRCDKMTRAHKNVADTYIKISTCLGQLATVEGGEVERMLGKVGECLEKARKIEGRVAADEDLKLSDTLRYYMRDTTAAKALLYRRLRLIVNHEAALKALEKARAKNKDVEAAEENETKMQEKLKNMDEVAKQELGDFKQRRINHFRKNLCELAELQVKHAKSQALLLTNTIAALKEEE